LDDIFSELDTAHRQHVIDLAFQQQTIIASVDWDEVLANALKEAQIVTVRAGKLN
jgi:recombinational DNA repair ATPase RecF